MAENNYQKALKERICERFSTDVCEDVYDFVREEALHSFKNGIQAGMKRAAGNAKAAPVYSKGSALKNGKLKPAERELVVEEEEE